MKIFALYTINDAGDQEVHLYVTPHYLKRSYRIDNALKWEKAEGYDDAEIVSIHGDLYCIAGKEPINDEEIKGEAVIVESAISTFIEDNLINGKTTSRNLSYLQEEVEEALCEIDEIVAENQAMVEEALCDIDMLLN